MFTLCSPLPEPLPPSEPDAVDVPSDGLKRQLDRLDRLADAGLEMAAAIAAQVKAAESFDAPAVAMAYARVARAVRLTLALQSRLVSDRRTRDERAAAERARAEAEDDESDKARVERIVERVIRAEHDDEDTVEQLGAEAAERLDDDDLYDDLLDRPLSEIVAIICRDLGLSPDWPRLAEEGWAQREIAEGEPGWPLASFAARRAGGLNSAAPSDAAGSLGDSS